MKFHLTRESGNQKVAGDPDSPDYRPVAVTTTSRESCSPAACSLYSEGCYASNGHLGMHWRKVTSGERGSEWAQFLGQLRELPAGHLLRHNQAGDLPTVGGELEAVKIGQLREATAHLDRPYTYTHYTATEWDRSVIAETSRRGFVVNASADTAERADECFAAGCPTTMVVASDAPARSETPAGVPVVVCPEQQGKVGSCSACMLCAKGDRRYIIGFRAHGSKAAAIDARIG